MDVSANLCGKYFDSLFYLLHTKMYEISLICYSKGNQRDLSETKKSFMELDRQNNWNYLKSTRMCDIFRQNQSALLNFSNKSPSSSSSSFDYTLFPSNATSFNYWGAAILYHVHRYENRTKFHQVSSVDDISHINLKVIKALCIKGNVNDIKACVNH